MKNAAFLIVTKDKKPPNSIGGLKFLIGGADWI